MSIASVPAPLRFALGTLEPSFAIVGAVLLLRRPEHYLRSLDPDGDDHSLVHTATRMALIQLAGTVHLDVLQPVLTSLVDPFRFAQVMALPLDACPSALPFAAQDCPRQRRLSHCQSDPARSSPRHIVPTRLGGVARHGRHHHLGRGSARLPAREGLRRRARMPIGSPALGPALPGGPTLRCARMDGHMAHALARPRPRLRVHVSRRLGRRVPVGTVGKVRP